MQQKTITILKIVLKSGIKILISGLALFFVFKKIDIPNLLQVIKHVNYWFLLLALICYNLSQGVSAIRLNKFLQMIDIRVKFSYNLRLYYKGMFYNLFLPGGIGGDGMKSFILTKHFSRSWKQIIQVLLLDRLSGFAGLLFLSITALLYSPIHLQSLHEKKYLLLIMLIALYPCYYLFTRLFFRSFSTQFLQTSLLGISVNIIQSISVLFLFLALGITGHYIEYMAVFYIADIALLFPFTIGGAGARELVFLMAPKYLSVNADIGVTFGLTLFMITVISSIAGVFVKVNQP